MKTRSLISASEKRLSLRSQNKQAKNSMDEHISKLMIIHSKRNFPIEITDVIIRVTIDPSGEQITPASEVPDAVCLCVAIKLTQADAENVNWMITVCPFAYRAGVSVRDYSFIEDGTVAASVNALLDEAYKLYNVWFKEPHKAFDKFQLWMKFKDEHAPAELNRFKMAIAVLWPIWQAQNLKLDARAAELKRLRVATGGADHVRVTAARLGLPKVKQK